MTSSSATPSTPRKPSASRSASVCYFYYGDSKYTTMGQETLALAKAMDGYSRCVLLKHDTVPGWIDLSESDEKKADVIAAPTRANLFSQLIQLTRDGYYIDLYIFSHGDRECFKASTGAHGSTDWITNNHINDLLSPAKTGFTHIPLRIVWSSACYASTLGNNWRAIGAKATAGARYVQFYPNSFGRFIADWNQGNVSFSAAVEGSDTAAVRTAAQVYLSTVHAPAHNSQWGRCSFGNFVLGDSDCAKKYFSAMWGLDSEWQNGQSGKENMNYSSYMVREGSTSITKNTRPTW